MARKKKQPKTAVIPAPEKTPKWEDPTIEGRPLAWRFSICDRDGPFSWAALEASDDVRVVLQRLAEFEKMNWDEILGAGCHPIACHHLDNVAQRRLMAIGQDDTDELMSFRISGARRLWCIRTRNVMRVLWWDPEHQVYPVEKDRADRKKRRRRG